MAMIRDRKKSGRPPLSHYRDVIKKSGKPPLSHYCDVKMGAMASQITSLSIVYSTVYSDADQRKHQSSASLAFVRGIHRGPVNSPHKWPVTQKMFPFDDVIMHIGRVFSVVAIIYSYIVVLSCFRGMFFFPVDFPDVGSQLPFNENIFRRMLLFVVIFFTYKHHHLKWSPTP